MTDLSDREAAHRETQDLLPWLANGRLDGAELQRVQAHLDTCATCRADLDALHTLQDVADLPPPVLDVDKAFARLLPQLDAVAPADAAPVVPGWRTRLAANDGRWLRAAVGLQFCAIVVLGALLLRPSGDTQMAAQDAAYRVLGAETGADSIVAVTFKPDTPEHELRRIVTASGAHIVGGPTVTGAWMLGSAQAPADVAARLRTESAVTLAEPLGMQASP
ncbi:zf-HC2 domain-containing protein [Massilia aurea]|jgi:anti-sigma factor RsiW|uniref:zf-HC2 domain-containing protein n=1 Tax=Massilia aurea TaxID=373040 RepID=UPI0021637EBE|nr:zf-HC2 domain-containing protein [Massilia aurea]MCS0708292.1 zf-HC2 domain-containing protein [Massilia aurea]